ncbi:MAG: asparagine synthase (glutamine-hydrolyzing) [Dehalococcoidia bacterium]|nr:asparagine synthase (glutamine-hydrolyzing) [Dehalococcoidia bacterium]
MCGICGIVNQDPQRPVDLEVLKAMNTTMYHRGPDDDGMFVDKGVGLAMRRLAIIDVAGGHQPVHNEQQTVWTVFNGEIYNYRELNIRLEAQGHQFYTHTDTETIVHAYEQWGEGCVDHFNGMYGFAIWDSVNRKLLLARDRMGIKPLYYALNNGTLVFGSELRAVLAHPVVARRLNLHALAEYLACEYVPSPLSIIEGVHKLPPGHILVFDAAGLRVRPYWELSLASSEEPSVRTEEEYAEELRERLRESVRMELMSDVPLGVFLSGGIDSSSLAAMMAQLTPGQVQSFSVRFEDQSFDESSYARQVAQHLGIQHRETTLEPRLMLELVPKLPDILDEPMGDSSLIPTYLLCQFARQHVTVALGGDGGDELLAGYDMMPGHRLMNNYQRFVPQPVRRLAASTVVKRLPVSMNNLTFDFKAKRFVDGDGVSPEIRHQRWLGSFTPEQIGQLLTKDVRSVLGSADPYETVRYHWSMSNAQDMLNKVLYLDTKMYLEGTILTKLDRASMAVSLEARVPLLNSTFVEFATRVPMKYKLKGLTTKYLFRKAMQPLLPANILARKKKGFNMPVAKWLNKELRPLVTDVFSESRLRQRGIFEPAYVTRLVKEHQSGRKDNRKLLWTLLAFELWAERNLHSGSRI